MLSVIIPTFNRAVYLPETINSILLQNIKDIEVLIIDDGSSDNTGETVESFGSNHPELKLRYIYQEHKGISAARNHGVLSACGEWIGFLDSDDLWHPEKAGKQLSYIHDHPTCELVFTHYENFQDKSIDTLDNVQKILMEGKDLRFLASAFVHRSLFERNGLFCEDLSSGEDDEWVLRNKILGVMIDHVIEEPLYIRRIHNGNISLQHRNDEKKRIGTFIALAVRNANMIRRKQS